MSLSPGTKVGPYDIVASLGAGGMGEVYRARDPKLNRDVAIKVLPALFAGDSDRLARFTREAQALAALNHPNIASIYEMNSVGDAHALVMELVEGDELSKIIARGPMPLAEAIPIARQIADALEAAHSAGIVHRDLKPANVKVRADGTVKVLDFGLAKAVESSVQGTGSMSDAATITSPAMTAMGMIMGTAAYMSPEQARGKPVDKRADIWAFGVVLFEMLTGRPAFAGETVTDVLASVVQKDPDWSSLPANTPASLRRLLMRALAKDRKQRLHDIGDARIELDEALIEPVVPNVPSSAPPSRSVLVPVAVAIAVTAVAMWLLLGSRADVTSAIRDVGLPPDAPITFTKASPWGEGWPALVVSPKADVVVYVADRGDHTELWQRSLVNDDARALPDTRDAYMLALHPDGDRVAFITGRSLKVTTLRAGASGVRQIAQVARPTGLAWLAGDRLFVPEIDGTLVTHDLNGHRTEGRARCFNPFPLSASEVLCGLGGTTIVNIETGKVAAAGDTGSMPVLVTPTVAAYSAWDGALITAPWQSAERRFGPGRQAPFTIRTEGLTQARQATIAADGTMVFVPGGHAALGNLVRRQVTGEIVRLPLDAGFFAQFDLSPDGRRVAVTSRAIDGMELSIYDIVTGKKTIWLQQPMLQEPRWSPDGSRLIVSGNSNLTEQGLANWVGIPASGLPPVKVTGAHFVPSLWYAEGDLLGYIQETGRTSMVRVRLEGTTAALTPQRSDRPASRAVLSPSRRLVAFMSGDDVVVETFPDVRQRVTVARGLDPLWIDDRMLLYRDGITWYRAIVEPDGTMSEVPKRWFADERFVDTSQRSHAVTRNGEVIYVQSTSPPTFGYLRVIPKWAGTIK